MISSETSFKKIVSSIFIFVIVFLLLPIGCSKPISKEKADQIAKTKLEEYCKKEGIEITRFAKPNISSEKKHPWIYEYVSSGFPKHILLIYIDRYGKTEMARMIE
jgi:hypothetical protein